MKELKLSQYVTGFVASVVLTLMAYLAVVHELFSTIGLATLVVTLGLVQFMVQLVFFLHLSLETKPRWKLAIFIFMVGVVLIVVFGSLWIMANLDYHMTSHEASQQLLEEEGITP